MEDFNDLLPASDPNSPSTPGFLSSPTSSISCRSSLPGSDVRHSLASPLSGHGDPLMVDIQSLSTESFAFGNVDEFLWTNDSMCITPVSRSDKLILHLQRLRGE